MRYEERLRAVLYPMHFYLWMVCFSSEYTRIVMQYVLSLVYLICFESSELATLN